MSIRKLTTIVLLTLGILAPTASAVHAEVELLGEFGNTGPGTLENPWGIGVNPTTGDVYVADKEHNRVVRYDAAGNFISEFAGQFSEPSGIAVDPNTGDVYVGDLGSDRVEKFDAAGNFISQITSGTGGSPTLSLDIEGIAVDLQGDLYVLSGSNFNDESPPVYVSKFSPSGAYLGVVLRENHGFNLTFAHGLSVDSSGFIYVGTYGGFVKFAPDGEALEYAPVPIVDPATGDVFHYGGEGFEEYNPLGVQLAVYPGVPEGRGAAYDPVNGHLYVLFEFPGQVAIYGTFPIPPAAAPLVYEESFSGDAQTTVTVHARVNPELLDTTYRVQYSTDPSLAGALEVPVAPVDVGSGVLGVGVNVGLTGLQPSTAYYYRVVAHNSFGGAGGSTTVGATRQFATAALPAVAVTGGASDVTVGATTISGTVDPGSTGVSSDTRWCFQYGTAGGTGYDLGELPSVAGGEDAGQGTADVPVSVHLTALQQGTTYRYRLVAINTVGEGSTSTACGTAGGQESDGPDRSFTTPGAPPLPSVQTGAASGVGQASATLSGTVDPNGARTGYSFQIGIDTSYGAEIFGDAGSGGEPQVLSVNVPGLQPGTTYHYRLVASNQGGTSYGADATFTTPVFASAVISAPDTPVLVPTPQVVFPAPGATTVKANAKRKTKAKKRPKAKRKSRLGKQGKRAGKSTSSRKKR
jgi:hypothetical protein